MAGASEDRDLPAVVEPAVNLFEELRRSSVNAIAVDVLYLFTTAFFASLAIRGRWPAAIAAVPLAVMLSFALMSSRTFFLTNVVVLGIAVVGTRAGHMPL